MHQDDIVAALVPVHGMGCWTMEMLLMFRWRWPDFLPTDHLGIRKGVQRVEKQAVMTTPRELQARGERCGPYRTKASMYLWRIADFVVESKMPAKRSRD